MYSDSPFKKLLSIINCLILPVAAIIWPLFMFKISVAILVILAQLIGIIIINLIIEKLFDNDDMFDVFRLALLIGVFICACYWPWIVVSVKLAVIFDLAQIAIISIALDFLSGGDLDFFEVVFVISLCLLAAYWPWIIMPFKPALVVFCAEAGLALLLVGAYIESDTMRNLGAFLLVVVAVGWPWMFMKYNISIIIILAELFLLALFYEVIRGFKDDGIVIGMFIFFILLAVGWPWLAFIGMEKYILYSVVASIGCGIVSGLITKLVTGLKK